MHAGLRIWIRSPLLHPESHLPHLRDRDDIPHTSSWHSSAPSKADKICVLRVEVKTFAPSCKLVWLADASNAEHSMLDWASSLSLCAGDTCHR